MKSFIYLSLFLFGFSSLGYSQVDILERLGQTPGGAGYHVNYDSASQRLFVGCGTSIWIYDTQDTANYHVIARRPLMGMVNETDLYGDILFVAATHDGVWALDASSDTLTPIAHYEMTGDSAAYDLWRTNDTLYIADGKQVRMLKFDSTDSFTRLATFGPDNSFSVARKGTYVAVGAQGIPHGTVMVYHYDNLEIPLAMWQNNNVWNLQDIQFGDLRDDIIYVCGGAQNLLFTASYFYALHHDSVFLSAVDSFSVPGIFGFAQANINNMDSQNDTLFISTGAGLNNLFQTIVPVYDATGLPDTNMVYLANIRPGLWHFDVARMHGTPYLAMSSEWLGVLISDVSQLQPEDTLGLLETGGWCQRAYIRGDTLWACMRGYGLVAYELDSLFYKAGYMNNPQILHIFTQFVGDMAFVNDSLIILSNGEFYNLIPWFYGGIPEQAGHIGVGTETIRTIQTNTGTRVVAGLSNLLVPLRQIAIYDPYDSIQDYPLLDIDSTNSDVNGLLISGDTIFCGKKVENTYYLAMFRVVNDSLILLDTIAAPGEISGISRDGSTVAIACGRFWFAWYYVDGNTLIPIGTHFDWYINPQGICLKNNLVYLADKYFGMSIYQLIEPPEAIRIAESRGTEGWKNMFGSTNVTVGPDGMIYLSDFLAGVIIIEPYDTTLIPVFETKRESIAPLKVIPNPFTTSTRLYIPSDKKLDRVDVEIYSIQGKLVGSYYFSEILPGFPVRINRNSLPAGMYICTILSKGVFIASGKLVIY